MLFLSVIIYVVRRIFRALFVFRILQRLSSLYYTMQIIVIEMHTGYKLTYAKTRHGISISLEKMENIFFVAIVRPLGIVSRPILHLLVPLNPRFSPFQCSNRRPAVRGGYYFFVKSPRLVSGLPGDEFPHGFRYIAIKTKNKKFKISIQL